MLRLGLIGIFGLLPVSCQQPDANPIYIWPSLANKRDRAPQPQPAPNAQRLPSIRRNAAFLHGQAVTWDHLHGGLVELGGGQALGEYVLDQALRRRLVQRGLSIDALGIEAEGRIFVQTSEAITTDPNEAHRLLRRVRDRQKLGDLRFRSLLWRSAALRLLVQDNVQVPQAAVRKAYAMRYGPKYQIRLIVVDAFGQAARIVERARDGESFIDLAIEHSMDSSRAQGGLLDPISPLDPTWPAGIREVLSRQIREGHISDPIILENGFGIVKLDRKIEAHNIEFDDVKSILAQRARQRIERMYMERLAREIVEEADLVILDSALKKTWDEHRRSILGQP